MDITARVRDLADKAQQQLPRIQTEEATKLALINPFIREVLGYDTTDLSEVVPEYTADVGIKKGEKVDYAILRDGVPLILIEAKKAGTRLQEEEPYQLYRYFTTTPSAQFGIYTDGIKYLFYSDLEKDNIMDNRPFLILDLLDPDPAAVEEVAKFVKSEFSPEEIRASATDLKYTRAIKTELQQEVANPSEEFVRLLMGRVYSGRKTEGKIDQFKAVTRRAIRQVIRDEVRGTFNTALAQGDPASETGPASEATPTTEDSEDEIITTEAELNGFYAVKAILHASVAPHRVTLRDAKRACTIMLDDNQRKPVCRFWFDKKQKYLGLFDENKKERRLPIDNVDEIFTYADTLIATAVRYG